MKKTIVLIPCTIFAAALLLSWGCGDNAFEPTENREPETGLAITGDSLATTIYKVDLKWWGSDSDGEVNGFEYRWTADEGTETFDLETDWTYTGFVKKQFLLPVTDSLASFLFEVRAIDNDGGVDASPASQRYPFFNHRPEVEIRFPELLPDSAWPVLALGWDSFDREGDSTIARHLIWVKGREANPFEVAGDVDSILLLPAQIDTFGSVTFFLQTVDEAYGASDPDTFDIFLHKINGEILLVDDYLLSSVGFVNSDGFYNGFLTERVGADGYTYIDLAETPFNTDIRWSGFLTAFEHVVWYSGIRQKRSEETDLKDFDQMALADSGLGVFIGEGGNLFMASLNAVGEAAGLGATFYQDWAGMDTVYTNQETGSSNFGFLPADAVTPNPCDVPFLAVEGSGLPDLELQCPIRYVGFDAPLDTTAGFVAERLYRVPNGTFKEQPADFYPLIRYDNPGDAGMVILATFPFSLYFGADNNDEVLGTFLDWFGAP